MKRLAKTVVLVLVSAIVAGFVLEWIEIAGMQPDDDNPWPSWYR